MHDDVRSQLRAGKTVTILGAATGSLSLLASIRLQSNQPASLLASIAPQGNQPAPSGALAIAYRKLLSGNQPAASGTLASISSIGLTGNQPAATGALARHLIAEQLVRTAMRLDDPDRVQQIAAGDSSLRWGRLAGWTEATASRADFFVVLGPTETSGTTDACVLAAMKPPALLTSR